jgi:N-acetylglucosaminyldiphosphoundecaprenol N-acetyl-beta-D-mannosaminyltransferase
MFCEGIGLKSAVFLTGQGWNNDTNGTDLFPILFKHLSNHKMKVFLLGASRQVIDKTVQNINNMFPEIIISGYHHGYIEKSDYSRISGIITDASPDLLILAMGMRMESDFIFENYNNISAGAIWCVGGLFDFISGNLVRAPKIIRKLRLEWLFRFLLQPKAKFQRIVITPFWFLKTVLIEHWEKK